MSLPSLLSLSLRLYVEALPSLLLVALLVGLLRSPVGRRVALLAALPLSVALPSILTGLEGRSTAGLVAVAIGVLLAAFAGYRLGSGRGPMSLPSATPEAASR